MLLLFVVFILGALTVIGVEAVGVVLLIRWLNRRVAREVDKAKADESLSSSRDFDFSLYQKQGIVWVLESERIVKQQKGKKEILEVTPVQNFAQVKEHSLFLTESDGSHVEIPLKGCIIAAVSASNLSSRKWAKRYPIKIESRTSTIYEGSRIIYIYLETCWEKEAWCKSLRLASCEDKEKLKWFAKLNIEFQNYLMSLNAGYPSFLKPYSSVGVDLGDKSIKLDGNSSKVRLFLKKLAKKASKSAADHDERKISERAHSLQDLAFAGGGVKLAPTRKPLEFSTKDVAVPSTSTESGSQSQRSVTSDADSDDRVFGDEGTLCWNLLISRLFFDAKRNDRMKTSLQARIQRTLSNMRIPSYIGEVTCTAVNIGNLPPYIRAMRVLPSDMNEFWAFEIDLQYSGGAILDVETRVAVQDLDLPEGDEREIDSGDIHDVKSEILEGFEQFGKPNHSEENVANMDQLSGVSPQVSRWKSIFNSVAKHVSQVPLSLGIRVASIQGTMRLYIKPPPSDQIWFGFTSMPDIEFHLDSCVGDHKISSGHLSLFLINRFKAAIRETLVLPNCESVCIPCMLAEKDDWVPRQVAPFIWINREGAGHNANRQVAPSSQPGGATRVSEADRVVTNGNAESKIENPGRSGWTTQQSKSLDPRALLSVPEGQDSPESTTSNPETKHEKHSRKVGWSAVQSKSMDPHAISIAQSSTDDQPLEELKAPLLKHEEQQESHRRSTEEDTECKSTTRQLALLDEINQSTGEDDAKSTKIGSRRARMLGLGKKMGEKLEERARHIEEKGRNLVERMRGQQ